MPVPWQRGVRYSRGHTVIPEADDAVVKHQDGADLGGGILRPHGGKDLGTLWSTRMSTWGGIGGKGKLAGGNVAEEGGEDLFHQDKLAVTAAGDKTRTLLLSKFVVTIFGF